MQSGGTSGERVKVSGLILQPGKTPLHEAAAGGHTATAEVLLKAGAHVKATNWVRSNALAAMISMVHLCALSDILPIHRRVSSLSNALMYYKQ